jgi:hypothetical protein
LALEFHDRELQVRLNNEQHNNEVKLLQTFSKIEMLIFLNDQIVDKSDLISDHLAPENGE